ncbi:IPT/TIG domain-containing protein [Shewanella olleyana]|uniref:IPT/TIG domain-containing protein n=1 Tax=Shewanella olleyana TaxID=135626 RepID=UPI00200F5740|nr:IPT/TIG domain-containing protein [Shewanella olleyana]MCL1066072.1 IPT/TIG domain-containing protein [Shewanella olleyana]
MKQKTLWLAMLLAASVGMTGCNGELEEGDPGYQGGAPVEPTDPVTPTNPTDPTDPTDPDEYVGTWENKDEDGDGVPDEQDDYPFDASKSNYPVFFEVEPNDNPSVATPIVVDVGVKVKGVIDSEFDKGDLFKFVVDDRQSMTAYFKSSSPRFQPQVYVSNEDGLVINAIFLYKYSEPNVYVVNFPIYDPGTYQLSVIDENFAGGSDLSYEMIFFYDEDVDSFDDMKERAFGSDLIENDMDNDEILDGLEHIFGTENGSIDLDNDTVPNWLDEDSDGDNFTDRLEGSKDIDNDSFLNFLDSDADGNGIEDNIESGTSSQPNDFDNDGIIDHLDLDDDNDNIFDVNDINRLEAAETVIWSKRGDLSIRYVSTIYENSKINFFLRAGDTFELDIEGYPATPVSPVLIVNTQGKIYNILPRSTIRDGEMSYLQFDLPMDSGESEVTIVTGDYKSEPYYIDIGNENLPLLSQVNPKELSAGSVVRLYGDNFDDDTTVFFNEKPAPTQLISVNEVTVTVPQEVTGGSYSVNNAYGKSNYISFLLQQDIQINVTQENALPIETIGGIYSEMSTELSGNTFKIDKFGSNAEVLFTYTRNETGELASYLSAIQYVNDTEVEFNYKTTALASLVLHLSWSYKEKGYDTKDVVELISSTDAFSQYMVDAETLLHENYSFFDFKQKSEVRNELFNKYESLINTELFSSGKLNSISTKSIHDEYAALVNQLSSNENLSILEPSIVSYPETIGSWDAFDMTMDATTFFENQGLIGNNCGEGVDPAWHEVFNYDGCVELRNRSQLYLSARVYPINSATGEINYDEQSLNNPLSEHIQQPYSLGMLGPQTGTFLGLSVWSADSMIDKCVYKDCLYQIITPALGGVFGPSPYARYAPESYNVKATKAQSSLVARTIIDNIVLRFFSILFDAVGIDLAAPEHRTKQKVTLIVKAVMENLPTIGTEIDVLLQKPNATQDDWNNLAANIGVKIYQKEILPILTNPLDKDSYGEITKALLILVNFDLETFVEKMVTKVAEKFIPGWGQIAAAYETSKLATAMIDMAATLGDLMGVPNKLDFIITWGLSAVDITPRMIEKDNLRKVFTIYGSGMAKVPGYLSETLPEVKVKDLGANNRALDAFYSSVNEQGTELEFSINSVTQLNNAVGPLRVEVHHLNKVAIVPYDVLIGQGLTISSITPNKASPGDEVKISGIGFSRTISDNEVTFSGANGQRLKAAVKSAATDELVVVVPDGAISGFITVEVAEQLSNEFPFSGPGQVSITFGDNGNFNDDVFKLLVNNRVIYDNNQPERKVGPIDISLEDGVHNVKLTGIRADDGIATYYIEFSGDITSVSGDELSGRDLCPNTHKNYQITVSNGASAGNSNNQKQALRIPMILQDEIAEEETECPVNSN